MLIKGDMQSPILVVTTNLSSLDLFYQEVFQGLEGIWFEKILKEYKVGYIGFEKECITHILLDKCMVEKILICGGKIQKILRGSEIYTKRKCLDIYHPSYLLQRSYQELDEEEKKIKEFLKN